MSNELAERSVGLVDLPEARRLIERAGRDGDVEQLAEWYERLGNAWAASREESNKAGEVKARIEREVGCLDLEQLPLGHSYRGKQRPFPIPWMSSYLRKRARFLGAASQSDFEAVLADLKDDPDRTVSPDTIVRLLPGANGREVAMQRAELLRARFESLKAQGLSQREIAKREGVSETCVSRHLKPKEWNRKRLALQRRRYREAQRARRDRLRLSEMGGRGDARGRAYVILDQQILALVDQASKEAESPRERQECNTAYDLALKLREALYRAAIERDIAA